MANPRFIRTVVFGLGLGLSTGNLAHAATTDWVGDQRAAVRLITATDGVTSDATLEAGLEFRFAKGWHGYWRTPGDAGIAPRMDWSGSENIARHEVAWPAPHRLVVDDLQNSVYEGHVILPVKLHLKKAGAAANIQISVDYGACSEVCVPYQAQLTLSLPQGSGAASAEASLISSARKAVPGSAEAAGIAVTQTQIMRTGSAQDLVVDLKSASAPFVRPDLFIEGVGDGIPAAPKVELANDGRTAHLTVRLSSSPLPDQPLTLTLTDGNRAAEFTVPAGAAALGHGHGIGLLAALLSALLGGLILNLMPCVLPVLSIKLFALTRHAGSGLREVRFGSAATAAGIVASFLLLAMALVVLKLSGATLGWGIQFQQPWFLAGMAVVTVLFAASFFEWLPVNLPSSIMTRGSGGARGPIVEAFLTGAFATLLATPCSAPFVGTAVGFALAEGPAQILAIFLCLGIGMALPYLVAALFPACVRWLPRPGAWMLVLRKVLGVLLLGTAAWLIFVLWSTAGIWAAATIGIALTVLLGYRALVAGPVADRVSRGSKTITAVLAIVPMVIGLSTTSLASRPAAESTTWQVFDPDALPGLVAEGKTVFVHVTATWCLTCKINDLTTLKNAEVRSRLRQPGIIRMRADWSRPDPVIADYLHRFGRYGIPLDVVYGPRQPQGEALPELLTPGVLLQALDRASAVGPAAAANQGDSSLGQVQKFVSSW
jgi:suppressor for copper-sensitivity B